ncbi:MAG: PAS domain S-box protein, partial [Caldilineae bacterium]
ASAFQQALYSETVIFRTFQEQVASLNLCGGLGLLDESGRQLTLRAVVCPGVLLSRLEKETGLQIEGLEFAVETVEACRQVIEGKEALFLPDGSTLAAPMLPPAARPFAETIFRSPGEWPAVCAPLVANGDVLGVLMVFGPALSPVDVPAATAFASLIAVALQNARLFASLRQEKAKRQASELRFRALFEQSPNPIFLLQPASSPIIVEANPAACALHGYTHEELVGRPVSLLDAPADAAMIRERQETLQREGIVHFTATHVRKDGSTFPVEITATRIEIEGEPFILSIEEDITERLRAEKELEAAHTLLQRTINGIEEPVMLIDLNYRVRLANRVVRERYAQVGMPATLQCCYQISHGRDTPCDGLHPCPLEEVRHTGRPVVVEHIHYTRQGEKRFVEIIASPLFNERGEVTGIIEAARDITDRKQAEETIMRLATAVEQATDSILISDASGRVVYANAAFERTTGYTRQEAIGREAPLFAARRHSPDFFRAVWETITGGEVWRGRFTNCRKDGSRFTEDVTVTPVRNEAGVITHYVSVHRDITHELELEEQYLQAQKMEAIGRLTGGIAHDFNNLLTAINGFASLLKMNLPPDSPHQKEVSDILQAGQSAATLIRRLMTFSRKQKAEPQILDLNGLVSNLDKLLRRIIGEDITLTTRLAADLWPVKADPAQMEQAIVNIAVNARDAMPRGGRLTI